MGGSDKLGIYLGKEARIGQGSDMVSERPSGSRLRSRLDTLLDGIGLLLLGWVLVLWNVGSVGVSTWPRISADLPFRSWLTIAVVVLILPLVTVVLVTLGRPSTRPRFLAAIPLLAGLTTVAVWRFLTGFVGGLPDGSSSVIVGARFGDDGSSSIVLDAGYWDGAATSLGLAATALLVIREYRLTRRALLIATVAVITSVTAMVIVATLDFTVALRPDNRDVVLAALALGVPSLLTALLGIALAPPLLRQLWRGDLRGAASLVLWGLAICAGVVLPQYLTFELKSGPGIIDAFRLGMPLNGLDWAQGAFVVAAAVLIAPVIRAYASLSREARASILAGPLLVLALLLIARWLGSLPRCAYWTRWPSSAGRIRMSMSSSCYA